MKTSLDHLPAGKRRELEFVVETLLEGFAEAISRRTSPRLRDGKLLKIILFGSYARGDWVDDPVGRYFSDYTSSSWSIMKTSPMCRSSGSSPKSCY